MKPNVFPGADSDEDHTDMFIRALHGLNHYSREASTREAKPVKEMYRDWFFEGKELVDWWTTLVRDMDLVRISPIFGLYPFSHLLPFFAVIINTQLQVVN